MKIVVKMKERSNAMSYFIEKRKHYRMSKEIKVRYRYLFQSPQQPELTKFFEATTKNISTTGVLIKGQIPQPVLISDLMQGKVLVFLEIHLPKAKTPVVAMAQLRWVESVDIGNNLYNMGLKFVEISHEDKNVLTKFILNSISSA
jgi:c-di-GMP-binding flagellar brake protein YcgR